MPNNPFVKPAPADKRIMPPRTALVPSGGIPAGEALNNWMPEELIDAALCFVISENSLFVFDKFSMAAASANVIPTCKGVGVPGRWVEFTAPAGSKDYCAISYANPNSGGAQGISALPQLPATFTDFDVTLDCISLAASGDLSLMAPHRIVATRNMTVKIDWFMSYFISGGGPYYEAGCIKNVSTPVPGGITRTYYSPVSPNRNDCISGSTIASLVTNDVLQLMVSILGSVTDAVFVMDFGTLVVTEL